MNKHKVLVSIVHKILDIEDKYKGVFSAYGHILNHNKYQEYKHEHDYLVKLRKVRDKIRKQLYWSDEP